MAGSQSGDLKMEGWLHIIRSNRIGLQYSSKRYFVLEDHLLKSFKSMPISNLQRNNCVKEPGRSAIIDSSIRVTDNGRESIHRKVFFIFTLYNSSNHNDQLKLGASSPEEAARWIQSLQEAALKVLNCFLLWDFCFYKGCVVEHLDGHTDIVHKQLYSDWLPWAMKRRDLLLRRYWRREDDGTYVILYHSVFHKNCPPQKSYVRACLKLRELFRAKQVKYPSDNLSSGELIRKVRLHQSVEDGAIDMCTQIEAGKTKETTSEVMERAPSEHSSLLGLNDAADEFFDVPEPTDYEQSEAGWTSDFGPEISQVYIKDTRHPKLSTAAVFVKKLHGLAGLELPVPVTLLLRKGNSSETHTVLCLLPVYLRRLWWSQTKHPFTGVFPLTMSLSDKHTDEPALFQRGGGGVAGGGYVISPVNEGKQSVVKHMLAIDWKFWKSYLRTSAARPITIRMLERVAQKRGYMDLQDMTREDGICCSYGNTLPKDPTCTLPCSWTAAEPSTFLIRGENYLEDHKKFKAKGTLMQMVAADWLRSDTREDDLGGRPGSIVQKYAEQGGPEFFFIINIQVPGSTTYGLALYYMMSSPVEDSPLLHNFINGDDAYRNSRFKLIPYISKGSWIVKQSVGKKACLIGQALEMNYFQGKNYLELGIDIGSSTVARGVVSLVLGYLNNLVIEMAFLIQANTKEELPEYLLGTCRLNHLDAAKSVPVKV
ncbi:hypothetical protein GOBAR_DD23367 [Gossypium barbadense]|nr:hypothetical protein GOBAR_DD23367 [Gossypium barbadense]